MEHLSRLALEAGLDHIRRSPHDMGTVELIACRPDVARRLVLEEAVLDRAEGLVGDNWRARGSRHTPDGSSLLIQQVTMTNSRVTSLVAVERERWALCGDQLYVDLDLSHDNLPAGTRLAIGSAVIEVSATPHIGCWKYEARFGREARRFVNTRAGRALRLRGLCASIITAGRYAPATSSERRRFSKPCRPRCRRGALDGWRDVQHNREKLPTNGA
ncbi:MAG: MOSC domain-containing protein [Candidatus Dormibacteria bacterium]